MTVKKTQQTLNATLENTEQALGGLENSLGNNEEASLHAAVEDSEANDGLPEGWAECLVGDYLFLKNGYAFKSNMYTEKSDGTFPIIRISDVDGRVASDAKAIHVSSDDVVDGFEVCDGDLLIAMSGATTGKVGIYKGALAYQNQRVGNIKLHSDELGNKVYKNYLIANLTPNILKAAYGGAQPNISGKAIEGIKIPLPPLAEQTVIAQTLDTLLAQVDNIKTRLDAIPKILKTFRQSVLAAAVSGKLTAEWRGENECGEWKASLLKDVCKSISDGDHQAPPRSPNGIPFLVISSVSSGEIDLNSVSRWVPRSYYDGLKDFRKPEINDLLYTVTGSFGIPVIVKTDSEFCFQRHIAILKPNHEMIDYNFLKFLLASPSAFKMADQAAKGTAQKTVSLTSLRGLEFQFPSLKEQTQIVRRVEEFFAFADQIEQQVKNAQGRVNNLTQSILAKAFRGELTADWRAENPELISGENSAEALLAKIQEERDALKQKAKPKKKSTAKKTRKKVAEK